MGSVQYMSDWRKRRYAAALIHTADSSTSGGSVVQHTAPREAAQ
jgi:hypothetical protein